MNFVIIGLAVGGGGAYPAVQLFDEITQNSYRTLALRASDSFSNLLTLIPLSVIAFGAVILFMGFKEKVIR